MEKYPVIWVGTRAIVVLPAEVDISNSASLLESLLRVIGQGATDVVADMSGTAFCDSSGVHALMRAHARAVSQAGRLHLVASSTVLLRLFEMMGVGTLVSIYPSVAAALLAAGTGPADPATAGNSIAGDSTAGDSTAGEGAEGLPPSPVS